MINDIFSPDSFTILDGGLGTMLQAAGLNHGELPEAMTLTAPEKVIAIHKSYVDAGAQMILTNTFGSNAKKLAGSGYTVAQVIEKAVYCAREACSGSDAVVALDIGPLGEMLEPAGTLSFEGAYELFKEVLVAGEAAGAQLVLIETMSDLYEAKAAVLAARENTALPVLVSMTFEKDGRTFTGVPIEAMAAALGGLGVSALGINCSLGPDRIMPLAKRLCAATPLPVLIKPNAGLPDPATGQYHLSPKAFCREMEPCLTMGVRAVGGCCGTSPDTIRALKAMFGGKRPALRSFTPKNRICSGTNYLEIDSVCVVGERINPTGKKRLQESLRRGDLGYVQSLAVAQQESGAHILDVNVGTPGVDEVQLLPAAVKAVQSVCDLPLMLDSANPAALEAALRIYNGKPIVNSTSGEKEKLRTILPLCKKYGASVVGLTLDEDGIPEEAGARFAIAKSILAAAHAGGMADEDVFIDCLTLAVSAQPDAAQATLQALYRVHNELGLKTLLGVSNISFGLPNRPLVNRTFLATALHAGLNLPIMNPSDSQMMDTIIAQKLLSDDDRQAKAFLARFSEGEITTPATPFNNSELRLDEAIEKGLGQHAAEITRVLLDQKIEGLTIVDRYLVPALDRVGAGFEAGTLFLPQLLAAAGAAQSAFEVIRSTFSSSEAAGPPIVIATVKGDVHDIGKNIVRVLLENYNFQVIDLGRDVPPGKIVEAAQKSGTKLVGLSALMTTTLPSMEESIKALRGAGLPCRVVVGGAVLTASYAKEIGADYYAKDAMQTVEIARELHGMKNSSQ